MEILKTETQNLKEILIKTFESLTFELPEEWAKQVYEFQPYGKILRRNALIASRERIPLCQDTGSVQIIIEAGDGFDVKKTILAINEAASTAFKNFSWRASMVEPLTRQNTGNNLPVEVHVIPSESSRSTLYVMLKGGGSEFPSKQWIIPPALGWKGIKERVAQAIKEAEWNVCPPFIVGVGIGGSFSSVALLAKRALFSYILRPMNQLEKELKRYSGSDQVFALYIEEKPTHMALLPLAVTFNCHVFRMAVIMVEG